MRVKLNQTLSDACRNGDLDMVKWILTSPDLKEHEKAKINPQQPIFSVCQNGDLDMVRYLLTSPDLKEHAYINAFDSFRNVKHNLLSSAVKSGNLDLVKYLLHSSELKEHSNLDFCTQDDEANLLTIAVEKGHLNIAKYLLTHPELKDKFDVQNVDENNCHANIKDWLTNYKDVANQLKEANTISTEKVSHKLKAL